MVFLTGEVAFPLHGAVILAFGFVEDDPHPFPGGKEGRSDEGDGATLTFSDHFHYRTNLGVGGGAGISVKPF